MRVAGAVLVGGQSRRMGSDKAALTVGDERMVDAVFKALAAGGCSPVFLVGPDRYALPTVPDTFPAQGPMAGLHAALKTARTPAVFLAACDMPLLSPALVQHLICLAPGWDAVVPEGQPVCAVYRRRILPAVEAHLHASRNKMLVLLNELRVRYVTEAEILAVDSDLRSFVNANTPAELERVRALRQVLP